VTTVLGRLSLIKGYGLAAGVAQDTVCPTESLSHVKGGKAADKALRWRDCRHYPAASYVNLKMSVISFQRNVWFMESKKRLYFF
jgi:hypothetical protein